MLTSGDVGPDVMPMCGKVGPVTMLTCGKFGYDVILIWERLVLMFEGGTLGKQVYHENFELLNGLIHGWIYNLIAVLGTGR